MAIVAQLVRVPDCGSVGRRFESDLSPKRLTNVKNQRISADFFLLKEEKCPPPLSIYNHETLPSCRAIGSNIMLHYPKESGNIAYNDFSHYC